MQELITPLHLAAQNGHFDVCKYICDNTMFVKPLRRDGSTPLTLAVHRGHIKIARLLHERDHPKRRIAWMICYFFIIFFVIYSIIDGALLSPHSWNGIWSMVAIICLTIAFIVTVMDILNDIWFSLRTSPNMDH